MLVQGMNLMKKAQHKKLATNEAQKRRGWWYYTWTATLGIVIAGLIVAAPFAYSSIKGSNGFDAYMNSTSNEKTEVQQGGSGKQGSPSPQTQSPGTLNTGNKSSAYKASVCTKTVLPYTTEYRDSATMAVGQTQVLFSGKNGYKNTCTPDSNGYKPQDSTLPPIPAVVWVGTKTTTTVTNPPRTYEQAANYCATHGVPGNSSAWQQCINAYLSQ